MKCPRCGFDIPDGKLYCEKCGSEIQIVPDFDPDLENSIHDSLETVRDDFDATNNHEYTKSGKNKKPIRKLSLFLVLTPVVLLILISISIVLGVIHHRNTSPDYQVKLANAAISRNDYMLAIEKLQLAYELDPSKTELLFDIADYYYLTGNVNDCVITLNGIAFSDYATNDDVIKAYSEIVTIYQNASDYTSIGSVLAKCQNLQVLTQFRDYMITPPEFNYEQGIYDEVIPLKMIAVGSGNVYYTLDGTVPDENSEIYTAPILLQPGQTVVKAIYINPYGVTSEITEALYDINVPAPDDPVVNLDSGDYASPQIIQLKAPDNVKIYYSTDLKEPTMDSIPYTGAFSMPLGQTTYKFIAYNEEGIPSEVVTRNYRLLLNGSIAPAECVNKLLIAFLSYGRIVDALGHAEGVSGRYLYQLSNVIHDDRYQTDLYILPEIYEDATGVQTKTGTVYAADAYSGQLFLCEQRDAVHYDLIDDLYQMLEREASIMEETD